MLPRDHDPTPFVPSCLPCLRLDDIGRRAATKQVKVDGTAYHQNPWVRELYEALEDRGIRCANLVIDRLQEPGHV